MKHCRAILGAAAGVLWLAIAAAAQAAVPFTKADVTSADNRTFTIAWAADKTSAVKVYAGTDPKNVGRKMKVGQGNGSGTLTVALPAGPRWYFELVPSKGSSLVVADRLLHMASVPNFRDAGGYRTADGTWVKMGLLYRSEELNAVSDDDWKTLSALGLRLVCDLRTDAERTREPDHIPDGASPLITDVTGPPTPRPANYVAPTRRRPAAERRMTTTRRLVASVNARAAYHTMFERLADPAMLPGVTHCSFGKDRTGISTAIFLSILGVPRETIMADYLLSNERLAAVKARRIADIPEDEREEVAATYEVLPEYLNEAFAEMERGYGTLDRYVREGLDLDDQTVARLRSIYLAQ